MTATEIIASLPYQRPFLFVDQLTEISENGISGQYTFQLKESFYAGHFKNNPVTPGVILTECMAQIGVVCLGIYLFREEIRRKHTFQIALTSSQVDFYIPVYPNEKVTVVSVKEVFRFQKLKCNVKMYNEKNELVCRGSISGMLKSEENAA